MNELQMIEEQKNSLHKKSIDVDPLKVFKKAFENFVVADTDPVFK